MFKIRRMKKWLLFSLVFTGWAQAQITVNSSSFPTVGDTIRVSVAVIDNQDYTTTGANQNWNFSALVVDSQRVTDYRPISETNLFLIQPYFGSFADAAHQASYYTLMNNFAMAPDSALGGLSLEDVTQYSKLTSTSLNVVGFSAAISGFEIAVPSDTIETVYTFPMDFGNTWTSKGYSAIELPAPFNLGLKQARKRQSEIDGWGSITTPYGTFDVLRVKHVIHEIDSFMVQIDSAIGPQWFGFELPEQHDYEWIAANDKEPILRITTNMLVGFETITSVTYRDIYREPTAGLKSLAANQVGVFPNPATNQLNVSSEKELFAYQILGLDGKLLRSGKLSGKSAEITLDGLPAGQYELRMLGQNGLQSKSFHKL